MSDETPFSDNKTPFVNIVEHWGKARMDIPMQLLARFDDAAKQLITLGTLLQGIYISIFTFGKLKETWHLVILGFLFLTLIAVIFCAAEAVCTMSLKREAFGAFSLFKKIPHLFDDELTSAMDAWCKEIDKIAGAKLKWLKAAKWLLFIHSIEVLAAFIILIVVHYIGYGR